MEPVARLGQEEVLVGEIDDGRLDLAVHHRDDAVFRSRHIAAVAELDAFTLGDDVADRFGAGAARMEGDGLPVHVFPGLVFLRDNREKTPGATSGRCS